MLPDVVIKCRRPLCDDCLNIIGRNRCTKRTTYCVGGKAGLACRRNCSRIRRLTALRSTAVRAFFLPIIKPRRGRGQRRRSARNGRRLAAAARAVSSPVDPEVAPAVGAFSARERNHPAGEAGLHAERGAPASASTNGTCNEGLL